MTEKEKILRYQRDLAQAENTSLKQQVRVLEVTRDSVCRDMLEQADRADRFLAMKAHTAGEYAKERDLRQRMEQVLGEISSLSGGVTPDTATQRAYENAMDKIYQLCLTVGVGDDANTEDW